MPRPAAFRTVALLLGLIAAGTLGVLLWRALAAHREVPPPLVPPSVAGPRVSAEAPPVTAARALADWRKALAAGDWQTANRIEDQVVQLGDAAVPQLEAALAADSGSPDPIAALVVEEDRAAALLGRIGTPAAVAALLRVRPHCADAEVRGQVLLALAKTGPAFEGKVEPVLESALTDAHETDEIRSSMPVLIAKRGETQGIADLCRLADQTAPADRQAAAWAITGLGFAPAAAGAQPGTTLRRILQQDAQPDRRALAAAALGQREDLADQPVLIAAAESDGQKSVRLAAVEALGTREPTPAAVQALARVLANGADKGVRGAAAQALGRPGAAANLPLLTAALNPRTPSYVQLKVVEAIEQIGGAPAQLALAAVATPPPPVPNPPPAVELTPEQKAAQVLVQNAARAALERMKNHPAPGHGSPEGVEPF